MKKCILTLLFFLSLLANGQNKKINQLNKENQKTGFWKLISKDGNVEITTTFLDGKYVSNTQYYKNKKLIASYNNELNELLIINDSVSTKAKFLMNEDSSRTLINIDDSEIDEGISNYFYSFSEMEPIFEGGMENLYFFVARNLSIGNFHGRLKIQFNIDPNGFANNIHLIEGNDDQLEKEAIRVFQKMPRWQPAHKNGVFKNTIMIFPLSIN